MRTFFTLLTMLWCATAGAQVVPLATRTGLAFEVKVLPSDVQTPREGNISSPKAPFANQKESYESTVRLELLLRNMNAAPAQAHLDWFFIAKDLELNHDMVWDRGERDVALAAGDTQKELIDSSETKRTTEHFAVGNGKFASKRGIKPRGWIVRLWSGNQLVRVHASSNEMETLGRNQATLDELLTRPKFTH